MLTPVEFGFLIGLIPASCMVVASFVLLFITIPKMIEATLQNFAAGLILGAVANELFPLLVENVPASATLGGSVIGFILGLAVVFGMESFVDFITGGAKDDDDDEEESKKKKDSVEVQVVDIEQQDNFAGYRKGSDTPMLPTPTRKAPLPPQQQHKMLINAPPVPPPKSGKMKKVPPPFQPGRKSIRYNEAYVMPAPRTYDPIMRKNVISRSMRRQIMSNAVTIDTQRQGATSVASTASSSSVSSKIGSLPLPTGLIIAVIVDAFTDGFLMGVSSVVSPKAAIILGLANCLEMSMLGAAYSARMKKCTNTPAMTRYIALFSPAVIMVLGAGIGAALAGLSKQAPILFVSFVAFGIVALLALACGELIIEAREAQGEEEVWYVSIALYVAILATIILNSLLA